MKKKPKKGAPASAKPLTKMEPIESFFNFFSPPPGESRMLPRVGEGWLLAA